MSSRCGVAESRCRLHYHVSDTGRLAIDVMHFISRQSVYSRCPPVLGAAALQLKVRIVQVACGARHTVFLTACGEAHACGWGKWGQLGLGSADSHDIPMQMSLPEGTRVKDAACGWWSTMLLAEGMAPSDICEPVGGVATSLP